MSHREVIPSLFQILLKKSRETPRVIPAKAGHVRPCVKSIFFQIVKKMDPLLQGDDNFLQRPHFKHRAACDLIDKSKRAIKAKNFVLRVSRELAP
jgi:hypothetical protein